MKEDNLIWLIVKSFVDVKINAAEREIRNKYKTFIVFFFRNFILKVCKKYELFFCYFIFIHEKRKTISL